MNKIIFQYDVLVSISLWSVYKESEVNKITPSLQTTDCYWLNAYVSVEQEEADDTTNSKDVNSTGDKHKSWDKNKQQLPYTTISQ